jgi:hypothetical protein
VIADCLRSSHHFYRLIGLHNSYVSLRVACYMWSLETSFWCVMWPSFVIRFHELTTTMYSKGRPACLDVLSPL